jgi:hypothetical protein
MTGWQPIETAPKDGTILMLFVPGGLPDRTGYEHESFPFTFGQFTAADYQHAQWLSLEAQTEVHDYGGYTGVSVCTERLPCSPTHWMPLPPPPQVSHAQNRTP